MALPLFYSCKSLMYMNMSKAVEGGLAGATVISLLTETLKGVKKNGRDLGSKGFRKSLKNMHSKKSLRSNELIQLAGQLLDSTAYLGLTSFGKRKNSVLRGAILGTAAGLGTVLLNNHGYNDDVYTAEDEENPNKKLLTQAMQVGLYTLGGLIAGKVIQKKKKKK